MDCNNYSFSTQDRREKQIARYDDGEHFAELTEVEDWFQDKYFSVWSDVEDDDGEWCSGTFDYTLTPTDTRGKAYNRAYAEFNRLIGVITERRKCCYV